ncbi:methyl-accepting chemotaxis protein [Xanthomonas sacchari]
MIRLLRRYRVGPRLTFAFAALLLICGALIVASLASMALARQQLDDIALDKMEKIRLSNAMVAAQARLEIGLLNDVILTNPDEKQAVVRAIGQAQHDYAQARRKLFALRLDPADRTGAQLRAAIDKAYVQVQPFQSQVLAMAADNQNLDAQTLHLYTLQPLLAQWQQAIQRNAAHLRTLSDGSYAQAVTTMARARWLLLLGGGLLLAVSAWLGWCITQSLVRPLREGTRVAAAIAAGQLDAVLPAQGNDEAAELLRSMQTMQTQLRAVLAEQRRMAQRHADGAIACRGDAAAFPGDYGQLLRDANALVDLHVGTAQSMVALMRRYAIGDLSEDMPRLPGEQAAMSEAMDAIKANLGTLSRDIWHLAEAAAAGDFSARADLGAHQHDFRIMLESLNQLMATVDGNLGELSGLLRAIASGDLGVRMHGDFHGVFADMRDDANASADQLAAIVAGIQHAAAAIDAEAGAIAGGHQDLSQRSAEQAGTLERTARAAARLTDTVRQNATHAHHANQLADAAATVAGQGGASIDAAVGAMQGVEAASRKIGEIIAVIDGIAFQTNILALNAAVEAARAGEQGRGFAVVASEVRALAQRSADAAKEIKRLIEASVDQVAVASAQVHDAGRTMGRVLASVDEVNALMAGIAAASQEQAAGIDEVGQAMAQMDRSTQQNLALVEQATAASRALEQQAGSLSEAVAVFRLADAAPSVPLPEQALPVLAIQPAPAGFDYARSA